MLRVKIGELKNALSRYLRAVRAGEEVEVLDRETPVARLVPATGNTENASFESNPEYKRVFNELVERGVIRPGTGKLPAAFFKELPPGKPGALSALLEERRESD